MVVVYQRFLTTSSIVRSSTRPSDVVILHDAVARLFAVPPLSQIVDFVVVVLTVVCVTPVSVHEALLIVSPDANHEDQSTS